MLSARGELCLMVDADGATQFSDLGKLIEDIKRIEKNGEAVVVGSRSHLVTTEAVVKVKPPNFGYNDNLILTFCLNLEILY